MAISVDASSTSGAGYSAPTWNHVVGSGENRIIAVGIVASNAFSQPTTTAVTCGGTSMTRASYVQYGNYEASLWLLHNPGSGSKTIASTITNSLGASMVGYAISYAGAYQSSSPDATGTTSGQSSGTKTATVTSVADNCWVVAVVGGSAAPFGFPSGYTHTSRQTCGASPYGGIEDTNAAVTPAGATSIGASYNNSTYYVIAACSFAPAAAAAGNPFHAYAQQ